MIRRLILFGLLVFVVIPAAFLAVEHLRGRVRLGDLIREQEARGERLGIRHFIPAPVSPASNGLAVLLLAAPHLTDASAFLPPSIRLVAPGQSLVPDQFGTWPGPKDAPISWPQVEDWLARNADSLELLRVGLAKPLRRADVDYATGLANLRLEHLSPFKTTVMTLSLSAAAAAHRGDLSGALESFAGMRAVESDLAHEPILISQLVRVACASIAGSRLWSVAHDRPWTEPELARLHASLPTPDLVASMLEGIEGERALCLQELRRNPQAMLAEAWAEHGSALFGNDESELHWPGDFEEAVAMANLLVGRLGEDFRTRVLFPVWRFAWGDQAIAYYLVGMDTFLAASREAAARRSLATLDESAFLSLARPTSLYTRLRSIYLHGVLPVAHLALKKAFRTETERALHETGLALLRYRLRHGHSPERLAELVPEFLAAVPLDVLDGQPLRYRRDPDGSFVLWSVGDDLKDQDGDPSWTKEQIAENPQWWRANDAVWPRPAGPGEAAAWKEIEARKAAARARANGSPTFKLSADLMKRYGLTPPTDAAPPATNAPAP